MRSRIPHTPARLLVVTAMALAGLAFSAQSAFAWHGRLQVAKVNQGGNPSDTFTFQPTLTWVGEGSPTITNFGLKGGETSQPFDVACNIERPGHVECSPRFDNVVLRVAEAPAPGYTLAGIVCRSTQSNDDNGAFSAGPPGPTSPVKPASEVTTDLATGTVNLKVHYNEWVVCTFTNVAVLGLPVVTAPSSAPSAAQQVSPVRVRPGSAVLATPLPCLTPDVVVARVTGKRIARVTFYVGHKKVKTLTRPNRGAKWVLSKRVRGLPAHGPYRVRARVEFTAVSQTKPKTLTISMGRCRSGASRPKFTG